eukprot:TRINITY_DN3066_c0_g1_i3.p1 TRINITY_DN3066_c0_g1~~TRINITY_DN3066_c0_g1_i3.p1  ORF type:complete len:875 (-),score=143.13 TRINITY_DN3066_c0_g1_i3:42-2666(-)
MVYSRQRGESREQQRPRSSEFELRPRSPEHSPPPQWDSSGDWEVQRRPQPDRRERRDGRDDREFEGRGHRSSGEGRSRGDRGDRDRQRSRHEGRSRSIRRHGRDGRPWHEKDDHRKSEGGRHGRRRRRSKSATRREAGKRPHSTRGQEGTEGPWRERRSPGRRRSRSQSRGRAARSSHAADPNVLRETMEVQASLSGRIIGRGGVCIMQVEKDSGAKVDVEKGAGAIHFSGSPEAIERAKEMVQNLIDEISAPKSAAAGDEEVEENVSQTIDLQPHEVGRIIGKKGETIMKLQTDTGTKIDVSKNEPYTVTVRGPCESVLKAIDLISELVEEANRTHTAAGDSVAEETTEQTMEVPKAMVGRIIGKGGQTITDMEKESGARIKVNSTDNSATVTIRGTHDQVVCAMDSITACIEDKADASTGPDAVEDVIELPVQDYGRVIGTAGGRINDVRDRTRATIQVSKDEDHCRVRLKGSEEQVQRAKDLVLQLVADGSVAPDSGADHKNLDTLGLPAPRVGRIIPGPRVDVAKHGPNDFKNFCREWGLSDNAKRFLDGIPPYLQEIVLTSFDGSKIKVWSRLHDFVRGHWASSLGLNADAAKCIENLPSDAQMILFCKFTPENSKDSDISAKVLDFVRSAMATAQGLVVQQAPAQVRTSSNPAVMEFIKRCGLHPSTVTMIEASRSDVLADVLQNFDPSGALDGNVLRSLVDYIQAKTTNGCGAQSGGGTPTSAQFPPSPPRVVAENVAQAKNMIAALLEASGKTAPGSSDDQSNDAGFGDENTSSGNPRPGADLLLNALKMHQSQKLQIRSKASAPAPPGSASAGSSPEDSEDCNPTDEPAKPLQVQEEPKKPAPARSRRGPPPKPSQAPELAAKDQ